VLIPGVHGRRVGAGTIRGGTHSPVVVGPRWLSRGKSSMNKKGRRPGAPIFVECIRKEFTRARRASEPRCRRARREEGRASEAGARRRTLRRAAQRQEHGPRAGEPAKVTRVLETAPEHPGAGAAGRREALERAKRRSGLPRFATADAVRATTRSALASFFEAIQRWLTSLRIDLAAAGVKAEGALPAIGTVRGCGGGGRKARPGRSTCGPGGAIGPRGPVIPLKCLIRPPGHGRLAGLPAARSARPDGDLWAWLS
jgi:hypothetical protein